MWRFVLLMLVGVFVNAQNLHITNSIPFGASSLKINLTQEIKDTAFNAIKISDNAVYIDIQAILDNGKKVYFFPNNTQVTIAQNTPQITRIVINYGKMDYQIKAVQKSIYISFIDKIPESKKPSQATPSKTQTSTKTGNKDSAKASSKPQQNKSQSASKIQNTSESTSSKNTQLPQVSQKPKDTPTKPSQKGYKVVIDAGHGGKDCGTMGVTKVCEKHIVLKVAHSLNKELKKRGYITYMTRDKDVYINLKERTDFANAKSADLFVSIHANSVPKNAKKTARGIETYFLSTARSDRARDVAEQENKDDIDIMNYFSKQTFLNSLNSHRLLASNKLAIDIQYGILKELKKDYQGVVDGGVREGPFWVLAGALMPSVLIEIGYNSNQIEAQRLNNDKYQKSLAIGIANGIDGFIAKNY